MSDARRVFVGIGSNIEPRRHVPVALDLLADRFGPLARSRVYETDAVGFEGAPFLNLVVGFDSDAAVEVLLDELRRVEARCGRTRTGPRFGPRTLDADLLLCGDEVRSGADGGARLPREEIYTEPYVLGPLIDLAPDLRDPRSGRPLAEWWVRMDPGTLREVELTLPDVPR